MPKKKKSIDITWSLIISFWKINYDYNLEINIVLSKFLKMSLVIKFKKKKRRERERVGVLTINMNSFMSYNQFIFFLWKIYTVWDLNGNIPVLQ